MNASTSSLHISFSEYPGQPGVRSNSPLITTCRSLKANESLFSPASSSSLSSSIQSIRWTLLGTGGCSFEPFPRLLDTDRGRKGWPGTFRFPPLSLFTPGVLTSFQSREPLTWKLLYQMSCPIQKTLCSTTESSHFFANTTPYRALQTIPVRRHLAIARSHGRNVTCFQKIDQAGAWDPMMRKEGCVQNVERFYKC